MNTMTDIYNYIVSMPVNFFRRYTKAAMLSVACIFFVGIVETQAGSLYKWIDGNGNVVYQDVPPPSSVEYEEQTYNDSDNNLQEHVNLNLELAAEENPISFYAIPNCDACDLIRLYLEKNLLPFAEKDVQSNVTVQQELQSLTGELSVPVLVVGDEVIDGYSKSSMRKVLIEKGYPIEQIEEGGQTSAASGTENIDSGSLSDLDAISQNQE